MNRNERIQHFLLFTSFILLVLTGFGLKFPESWWVKQIVAVIGDNAFEARGIVHRVASVVLILVSVYHLIYLFVMKDGKKLLKDFMPVKKDLSEFKLYLLWLIGKENNRPQFGRFSYIEKMEYWAVVWGTVIMGVTGFILWFKDFFFPYISNIGIDIASEIHFYEAVLATLAIIVWHFYFVFFNPDVAPMNKAWITGEHSKKIIDDELETEQEEFKTVESASETIHDEIISEEISSEEEIQNNKKIISETSESIDGTIVEADVEEILVESQNDEIKIDDNIDELKSDNESTVENIDDESIDHSTKDRPSRDKSHSK